MPASRGDRCLKSCSHPQIHQLLVRITTHGCLLPVIQWAQRTRVASTQPRPRTPKLAEYPCVRITNHHKHIKAIIGILTKMIRRSVPRLAIHDKSIVSDRRLATNETLLEVDTPSLLVFKAPILDRGSSVFRDMKELNLRSQIVAVPVIFIERRRWNWFAFKRFVIIQIRRWSDFHQPFEKTVPFSIAHIVLFLRKLILVRSLGSKVSDGRNVCKKQTH
mmetsp:Transcript_9773/g.27263  ORF Transcript_9773/g.27263 Transcript_9773/m.27263 type:complete len:219 (+) Transcript_9773:396-1052(+)